MTSPPNAGKPAKKDHCFFGISKFLRIELFSNNLVIVSGGYSRDVCLAPFWRVLRSIAVPEEAAASLEP